MDIDIAKLAAETAALLAPFLPYLIKGGKIAAQKAFEKTGEKLADAAWDKAEKVWGKIWPKAKKKEAAKEAVEDAAQHPKDDDAQGAFRRQLTKLLEADEKLRQFVAENVMIGNVVNIGGNVEDATIIAGNDNKVTKIINHIQGNVYNGPAPRNPQDALKVYRAVMANMTSSLSMRGIDLRASDPNTQRAIGLANVYIDLDTTTPLIEVGENLSTNKKVPAFVEKKSGPFSALEAVIQYPLLIIKGDPGSGKSTFVNFLTYCLSTRSTDRLTNWKKKDANLLPVIVILRDFVRANKKLPEQANSNDIWKFIDKRLKDQNLSSASKPIQDFLEQGHVIVFFDGLDEVSTIPQRLFVRDAVHAFVKRFPKNRYVVTCRILSYTEPKASGADLRLTEFPEFELAPFDEEKINSFIDHWYGELTHLGIVTPELADDLNKGLKTAVQRAELSRLAPNPLLLTVMAVVNTHKGRLPDARALLYKETVEILLWQWEQASKGQDAARLRQLLLDANCADADLEQVICKLAYEAHAQTDMTNDDGETLAGVSELNLQKALAAINKGDLNWAASIIETMKLRAGLLLERENNVFTFPHRSFQEFLAGTYIEARDDFVSRAKELADNQLLWRQVILWAVSRRVYIRGSLDGPLALVAELCPSRALQDEKEWSRVWLAGDILLEIGLNRVERSELGKELLPRVQNRLVELLEGNHLSPRERAEAGDTLSKLGDPRFDADKWHLPKEPLLGFVHVPAGEFTMGTKEKDIEGLVKKFGGQKDWYEPEVKQHTVNLPDFYLARYPVTVAQFKFFAEESGYKKMDDDSLQGIPNHPVRYVTWFDAIAYCNWLNEKLKATAKTMQGENEMQNKFWQDMAEGNLIVTLPSEAEWEKAARGALEAWEFPWGDEFDQDKVNNNMTIGRASAVGCFPRGRSPYEIQDMAGNVWEWTRSIYEKYSYEISEKREDLEDKKSLRVLRGGAFNYNVRGVRCAYRDWYSPVGGYVNLGFRVVVCVVSPISL